MKRILTIIVILLLAALFSPCKQSTEPVGNGGITGVVTSASLQESNLATPAYIFLEDSLVATTNSAGEYTIASLAENSYQLTCSALGYRDTVMSVVVTGGQIATQDFSLAPDSTTGTVYGEFQDLALFDSAVEANPDLRNWDARQIYNGVTGATLQSKTLMRQIPPRQVHLGDSLLALSDDFGQFWFELQSGTYPVLGSCEGYQPGSAVCNVQPNTRNYVIFYLEPTSGQIVAKVTATKQ